MLFLTSLHNTCFSSKNLAFKVALISKSRAQRGQIKKIRPLLLTKLFEVQEPKWPYFFEFRPLSLRNCNKGQNEGHSPRDFQYGLFVDFFHQQAGFWYDLPSHKVWSISMAFRCPKQQVCGLLTKRTPHFPSLFFTFWTPFLVIDGKNVDFFFLIQNKAVNIYS